MLLDENAIPGLQKDTPIKYVQLQVNDEPTKAPIELQSLGRVITEFCQSTEKT